MNEPRTNLGWANSWNETPAIVTECRKARHKVKDKNLDGNMRGHDTLYWCDECGYEYHVDSSD